MKKFLSAVLACSLAPLAAIATEQGPLEVSNAWVRALPPGQPNTAAYLTVSNSGATPVTIVGASAEIADRAEIHTSRTVEGLQRMERLMQLQVAPGQSVAFAPGGKHLMLLGLKRMPVPGEDIQLCLQLAQGARVCTIADVRKSASDQPSHEHHQH